ncbi:MAG TPA: bifunctional 4-hydroxy-2-oxoglutarate aldolase/2-dehydro-3-deoxy-phosphogluconate aldolase [Candidatus Aminicenantes bacterium]|nr:bifunctional 4-hydroxy-2-oxoglutarate aldolase/2-dehydro-3-deoxy-phosphogluconate aldolase [Candidatus Aminicenantes bacterium]HRY65594.1 bifunctional 4-hydroxy-2-oxoglutarate aldolase/2-dehydro-3-deoxy-phosphogluconate aldolase [Candidatus Aminicenantes bacterium]HRZ72518.1 bifunctional 4-hydroxy-2-oxoglutarate aldolase/2-dehydro-3-deoxy-phosphogluconate aldolase [Candidatus Aminicenantes bacterium]
MTKDKALEGLLAAKAVAVIRMKDAARVAATADALRRGGVTAIEITMTVPGAAGVIREMAKAKAPGLLVGAGTVLDAKTAAEVIAAGADFVVSPIGDAEMIAACREAGVLVVPGAFSPTEIVAAWRAGADIVKVFPATSLGPAFFRDLRGPLPQVRLMPTGGVTLENARDFIAAGACCVGLGTALVDAKTVERCDWSTLETRARTLMASLGSGKER